MGRIIKASELRERETQKLEGRVIDSGMMTLNIGTCSFQVTLDPGRNEEVLINYDLVSLREGLNFLCTLEQGKKITVTCDKEPYDPECYYGYLSKV